MNYSIHCLSNGSEYTHPCLLLQVQRPTSVVRYAFQSAPTSRLAADQAIALHTVRAVFGTNLSSLGGLLLACHEGGVGELTVCSDATEEAEQITNIVLGPRRSHPLVKLCKVPRDGGWYLVYQDEFVRVHGKYDTCQGHLIWICTLQQGKKQLSIAVGQSLDDKQLEPLPEEVKNLECLLVVNGLLNPSLSSRGKRLYITKCMDSDSHILMRATRQARFLAQHLPFAFHYRNCHPDTVQPNELGVGTRLCLETWKIDYTPRDEILSNKCPDFLLKISDQERHVLQELQVTWDNQTSRDENEIDLDEDEVINAELLHSPHLLVLGTGCATPSPMRGSSGYAIVMPSRDGSQRLCLTGLLDCGQGTLTSLFRFLPETLGPFDEQLLRLRFIWISHSHLDHYEGLPDVLTAIHRCRQARSRCDNKRHKLSPVFVVAPPKVLKYLQTTVSQETGLFKAATHADWAEEPPKDLRTDGIVILRNIPVHHCADAHALLIGFDTGFTFCYSGDTRPCGAMVRAVPFNVSLLLHEATFDDDERGRTESLHKKHSTVAEALTISREMGCKACLLTHFSQRYPKAPPSASLKDQDNASFAVDGMWIPLTNEKILNLSILSKLIHQMIYK